MQIKEIIFLLKPGTQAEMNDSLKDKIVFLREYIGSYVSFW